MYSQVITRCHRTAFVIAVDQSSSMQGETTVDGRRMSKAEAVALITNSILEELLLRASHSSGLRNYYDVAVIGYADERVYSLIEGEEGPYGLYIKSVLGQVLDYETDGMYWSFYVGGEYAMTGVDLTPVTEGEHYMLKAESAEEA